GLRDSDDVVEQEGIRRALEAIEQADQVLLMIDSSREHVDNSNLSEYLDTPFFAPLRDALARASLTVIQNKIDLAGNEPSLIPAQAPGEASILRISAKDQLGIQLLKQHLKDLMGYRPDGEGSFIARRRHLDALNKAEECLQQASLQLSQHGAAELVAEDLRHAHRHLGEITGAFTTDDLLGRIFSSFCIGK